MSYRETRRATQHARSSAGTTNPSSRGAIAPRRTRGTASERRHPVLKAIGILIALVGLALVVTGLVVYASLRAQLPDTNVANARGRDQSTIVYDIKGRVIAKLFADQNRTDKPLTNVPLVLREAVIATEDRRFYQHKGVDPLGILRAGLADVILGAKAQGGSTITQQYVKQAFVTPEKTLKRKIMEAMLANELESKYSKDEILQLYLNTIYFGHGAYGVESAAQAYFGKSVDRLDLPEAAMIAGVIRSPGRYSPYVDPKPAHARRDTVLALMREQGYITRSQYDSATSAPIRLAGLKRPGVAPYFVDYVREQILKTYGSDSVYRGGLRVYTTLDLPAQRSAERAVASALGRPGDPSAALVAIEPGTGAIRAMVGGRSFAQQQFNVASHGARQPGSAFKPFVLAAALADGVSPEATFRSGPMKLDVGNGEVWSVTGAHGGATGPMRLRVATEQSVNSVFAQLILKIGPDKVVQLAEKLGIHEGIEAVPAIALGGLRTGVSPLEMADAYATFAANGIHATPYAIARVTDSTGKPLFVAHERTDRALDPAIAYLTTNILRGVVTKGTGTAAGIGRPVAGKTGTTQEYRDAWFVGYTPQLATAVWVGYPSTQRAMNSVHGIQVTGGSFPAQIWADFMKRALAKAPVLDFTKPPGLKAIKICLDTGQRATAYCPRVGPGLFLSSRIPGVCTVHTAPTTVVVPALVGLSREAALSALKKVALRSKITLVAVPGVPAGTVAAQNPAPGAAVSTQTVVALTVSSGDANQAPRALISMPAGGKPKQKISLDGSGSSPTGKLVSYAWDFGDGDVATGPRVQHAYAKPGSYTVTLKVTDDQGRQSSVTQSIVIK